MTDTLADWIRKGFVAGPFSEPPLKKFRSNPLMAVVQKTKVRPILNLSSPLGNSFNDAVVPESVDKLKMCSAKMFAETLVGAKKFLCFVCSNTVEVLRHLYLLIMK